jgi:hypothetical protein
VRKSGQKRERKQKKQQHAARRAAGGGREGKSEASIDERCRFWLCDGGYEKN